MKHNNEYTEDLTRKFKFHHIEQERLTNILLRKLSYKINLQLKIQKSSIQLLNEQPYAVIGYRKNQLPIFIEFYSDIMIS